MKPSLLRTLLASPTGGVALNLGMLLTFRLLGFGWNSAGILLDPSVQSAKLIAVRTQLEPLPLIVAHPLPVAIELVLFSIGYAFIYRWLAPSWPVGVTARALRMATLFFSLSYLFWEFVTPFNMFGEPLKLIGLELTFGETIALAQSFALAAVFEWKS